MASRVRGFLGGIIRQIMDVEDIAGGEDAGDIGLQGVVYDGPSGDGGEGDAGGLGQFIFGDQPAGEKEGVALVALLGARDRAGLFVNLSDGDRLHPVPSFDVNHGVTQLEGDVEVIETLNNIALETSGIGHELSDDLNLCPL